ncbi:MAG: hypothetical protein AB4042_00935, partial [Leptolyngbyaceae cyanobacterium]
MNRGQTSDTGMGGASVPALLSVLGMAIATALAFPAAPGMAQETPTSVVRPLDAPPGLCDLGQRDTSGRWINDGTGEMVPLARACEVATQVYEDPESLPEETRFWAAFVAAASEEAMTFATASDPDAVVAYGKAVCASLLGGGS